MLSCSECFVAFHSECVQDIYRRRYSNLHVPNICTRDGLRILITCASFRAFQVKIIIMLHLRGEIREMRYERVQRLIR